MKKTGILLVILLTGILTQQCLKTPNYEQQEQEAIRAFLEKNNITAEPTASGLYYIEMEAGDGLQPVEADTVSIHYITYTLDNVIIDTSIDSIAKKHGIWDENRQYGPFTFVLGSQTIIPGINEGVSYMKEGGTATLIVPSSLAYQNYQPLGFYIELLEVKHDTTSVK